DPDPELVEQARRVALRVSREARMDRTDRDEAVRPTFHVPGDPLVDRLVEAHHFGSDVVDQCRPLDSLLVHQTEELLGVGEDALESLAVGAAANHRGEDLGMELLPRLDVDVAVEDAKRQRKSGLKDVRDPEPDAQPRLVRPVRNLGAETAEEDRLNADALPRS